MAYKSEDIEIKSLSVLKEKMDDVLSAAQEFKDVLYGNRVELVFNTVGGNTIQNRVVYRNQSFGILPVPFKAGYDFVGWYANMVINNGVYFYATPINNMEVVTIEKPRATLYAKWEPAYIEFELDARGGTVSVDTISVRYLDYFAEAYQGPGNPTGLPTPTHIYDDFVYWSSDPPNEGNHYRGSNRIEAGTTNVYTSGRKLYANWRNTDFFIYYDVNGGSGGINLQPQATTNLAYNKLSTIADVAGKISKDGFVFKGFTDVRGSSIPREEVFIDGRSVTVYAIWERERYELTYLDGENGKLLEPTVESGNSNPQSVLLDWIDYLNFVDEFKLKNKLGKFFARWTTPPAGKPGHNPWVANLKPEDGDILWNYNMAAAGTTYPSGKTTLYPIPMSSTSSPTAYNEIPNWKLIEVGLDQGRNPLAGISLKHGDSTSAYQYGERKSDGTYETSGVFVLSAKLQSISNENSYYILRGLSGEQIRVYPRQAVYRKPIPGSGELSNSYVAVSFAYNTVMEGIPVPVTVEKTITRIELIDPPDQLIYMNGSDVDTTGLRLSVIYSDGVDSEEIYFDSNTLTKGIVECSMRPTEGGKTQVSRRYPNLYISATYGERTVTLPPVAFTVNLSSIPVLQWDAESQYKKILTNTSGNTLSVFTGKRGNIENYTFNGAYEPEGEPVGVDEYNLITNLKVYAYYGDEDNDLCPVGWDKRDPVFDYFFSPNEISEKIMRTWKYKDPATSTTNNKTGRIADLSIYWRVWSLNDTISTTVPVSVFEQFGVDRLILADRLELSDVNWSKLNITDDGVKLLNCNYSMSSQYPYGKYIHKGIITRIPISDEINNAGWTDPSQDPIFGAWKLTATYNRPNAGEIEIRLSDCTIEPSIIDFATSKVTASFDYASVAVDIRPTLQGSCYCGFIEVAVEPIRARGANAAPWFLPQSYTSEAAGLTDNDETYRYNYNGTKYLAYHVVYERPSGDTADLSVGNTERKIKTVVKRSTADAEVISMTEYLSVTQLGSNNHMRISVYYTNPDTVTQWNSPLTDRTCRQASSFITRIDIAPVHLNWGNYTYEGVSYPREQTWDTTIYGAEKSPRTRVDLSVRNIGNGLPGYYEDTFHGNHAVGGLKYLRNLRYVCYYQQALKNFYIKNPINLRHAEIGAWWASHPDYCDHPLATYLTNGSHSSYICCHADANGRQISRTNWPYYISGTSFSQTSGVSPVTELKYMTEIGRKCFTSCTSLEFGFLMDDGSAVTNPRISRANSLNCDVGQIYYLPASIRRIGYAAFAHCKNMRELHLQNGADCLETYDYRNYNSSPLKLGNISYSGNPQTTAMDGTNRSTISCFRFGNTIHRLSCIKERAFYDCTLLQYMDYDFFGRKLASGDDIDSAVLCRANRFLSTIDEEVFAGCTHLNRIALREISHISAMAFYRCVNLISVYWPQRIEMYVSSDYSYSDNPSLRYLVKPDRPGHYLRNFDKMKTDKPFGIAKNDGEKQLSMMNYRAVSMSSYFDTHKAQVLSNRSNTVGKKTNWEVKFDSRFNIKFYKSTNSGDVGNVTGSMTNVTGKMRAFEKVTLDKCAFKWSGHSFQGWKWTDGPLRVFKSDGTVSCEKDSGVLQDQAIFTVRNRKSPPITIHLSAKWS